MGSRGTGVVGDPGRRRSLQVLRLVTALVLAACISGELIVLAQPALPGISVQDRFSPGEGGTVRVQSVDSSGSPVHLERTVFERGRPLDAGPIYFYFDANYPVSYNTVPNWYGLDQHLQVEAAARGVDLSIHIVDAEGLIGLLNSSAQAHPVLIVASGVLPATVWGRTVDVVTPWIKAGGVLLWVGDGIGVYSGHPGSELSCDPSTLLGIDGIRRFFDPLLLEGAPGGCGPARTFSQSVLSGRSQWASAFGLDYPYAVDALLFRDAPLEAAGGFELGAEGNATTNLADLPIGNGTLVDLAGAPVDDVRLGSVLLTLLETGLPTGPAAIVSSTSISLGSGASAQFLGAYSVPLALDDHLCVFTGQTDYVAAMAVIHCAGD
jgi:hypothetical protein